MIKPINQNKLYGFKQDFNFITNLFDNQRLPQKIIFSGNKGIGKSVFVYHLINYIFSLKEDNKYNLEKNIINIKNRSFKLINSFIHPNFFILEKKINSKYIEVNQIRDMISFLNKSSFDDNYKIVFINNIQNLNQNSLNALLKNIEEPSNNVLFFLTNNIENNIRKTLLSRCVKIRLILNPEFNKEIINEYYNQNIYDDINKEFINYSFGPSSYIELINFCFENNIDYKNNNMKNFISSVIEKKLYLKFDIQKYINLYLKQKALENYNILKFYSYFNKKYFNCIKYNLDLENYFSEIRYKLLYD